MTEWQPLFLHPRTGRSTAHLREIYGWCSPKERQLSFDFYNLYPAGNGIGSLTPFVGILQGQGPLADGCHLVSSSESGKASLQERLSHALVEALLDSKEVAIAVSGGVDCWLLAALCQKLGYSVCGWYLESGLPGYCEREQMLRLSDALGIECRCLRVAASDFVDCLAEFTAVTQMPVYNLHPVSKWLLARGLREQGITTVVTGDAADQVMRWDWDCDLLPITISCFKGAGIQMVAPFMADDVIAFCRQPFADKEPIRKLARDLGVPSIAKQASSFPPLALPAWPRASLPTSGAAPDQLACLAYTTGVLQQWLEGGLPCAG